MSEKRKVPILNSLRRPSSPRSKASEEAFNISPISPRVEWKPPKPWSSIGFEQNMILRNDIPPPPPGPPPHYHDLIGPPGLSKSVQTASLFVPSEVSKSNKEASDVAPPPLKVKHFSQVSSLLKPLVEAELLRDKTLFPLDWLPPPDDLLLSPRGRTSSALV